MKKIHLFRGNMKKCESDIKSETFSAQARQKESDFTRNRSLPLPLLFMLIVFKSIKTSMQLAIDDFFDEFVEGGWRNAVTKQAFSKSRTNFNPDAIKNLFTKYMRTMCKVKDYTFWNEKYRLVAIDGSKTALYNSPELREEYGTFGGSEKAVGFLNSMAYDPLNDVILDASINHCDTSERECAKAHIEAVSKLPIKRGKKNLFTTDRGYPSVDFLSYLIDGKHSFIMRVRNKFNLDFDHVIKDDKVIFEHKNKKYRVRIIKITLPKTGEIETLVTNLNERDLQYEKAGELYFERWGIETKFGSLKNKLELENMSGRRVITVQQDFWATMLIANLYAALEWETNEIIAENTANSELKYAQTTNENRLVHRARKMFIKCLLEPNKKKRSALFDNLAHYISSHSVDVKPGRSSPRSTPRDMKFHDNYKSVV